MTIASIVEGEGEVSALPKLPHRLAAQLSVTGFWVPQPRRVSRSKLVTRGEIERAVSATKQALRVNGAGGVLVLLDADDDCPAQFAPALLTCRRQGRLAAYHVDVLRRSRLTGTGAEPG